jgi:hypothetical protein
MKLLLQMLFTAVSVIGDRSALAAIINIALESIADQAGVISNRIVEVLCTMYFFACSLLIVFQ